MAPTTILITGANRGLGKGLLERYLAKPNHIVIAGNRDPKHATSKALADLPCGQGSRLIVLKIDASNEQDAFTAVEELQTTHGIDRLDVVVANAGVSYVVPTVADLKLDDLRGHLVPNVYGLVTLYQATLPLMKKSTAKPIFAPVGSSAGLIGQQPPIPNAAYGPSKAMVSWYGVRINAEEQWLHCLVLNPGFVETDMGVRGAKALGWEQVSPLLITVKESCDGMFKVLETTTKEKHGGKLVSYNGDIVAY